MLCGDLGDLLVNNHGKTKKLQTSWCSFKSSLETLLTLEKQQTSTVQMGNFGFSLAIVQILPF